MTSISQIQNSFRIVSIAMATMITVTSGFIYGVSSAAMISDAPTKVAPTFVSDDRVGAREASRVVWCVMPAAWQRACDNSRTKTVGNSER